MVTSAPPARGAIVADGVGRSDASTLTLDIYDTTGRRVGRILDPVRVELVERRLATSSATVVVHADPAREPYVGPLRAPGARVHIRDGNGYVLGGPVTTRRISRADGTVTVTVEDYVRIFYRVLGWPVPSAPLTAQTRERWRAIGQQETVVKALAKANFDRLAMPVTVAPDRGRGRRMVVEARMEKLSDVLLEALTPGPLDLRMRPTGTEQRMTGLTFDVAEPPDYPVTITADSDVLADYTIVDVEPETTRVVLGGGGEGVDRDFFAKVDGIREAERGGAIAIGETFVDGRNLRTDYDAALRDVEAAQDDVIATRVAYGEALSDQRAVNYEGQARVNEVQIEENQNVADALDALREAQRANPPVQSTIDSRAAAYEAALQRRIERIGAARATRDSNNGAAAAKVAAATTERDVAAVTLQIAQTTATDELAAYRTEVGNAMTEALLAGGPKVSASVVLAETASFQWDGDALQIGTRVPLDLDGVLVAERIRERRRTYTSAGLDSVPVLGEREESPDIRMARRIAALSKAQRADSTR